MTHIALRYDGEGAFTAHGSHAKRCDAELVVGEFQPWERVEIRSTASHSHFFAQVNEAWMNLNETLAEDFPNAESLRKWALIKGGYCTMERIVAASNTDAVLLAALAKSLDSYVVVTLDNRTVTVYRAESMSYRAMGKEKFQQAKDDCLRIISELIGANVGEEQAA